MVTCGQTHRFSDSVNNPNQRCDGIACGGIHGFVGVCRDVDPVRLPDLVSQGSEQVASRGVTPFDRPEERSASPRSQACQLPTCMRSIVCMYICAK